MNPEDRRLLLKSIELGEENNAILRRLQRTARWGTFFKVFYWTVIIAISFGTYFFLQPYVEKLQQVYGNNVQTITNLKQAFDKFGGNTQVQQTTTTTVQK